MRRIEFAVDCGQGPVRPGEKLDLVAGVQLSAEIHLGPRTVFEYLLSPVQKIAHETGRER